MSHVEITEQIKYIGADDKTLDLFESQYLIPNGVSYNSYLILDEKIAVMDTVDMRATGEWLRNMDRELQGKEPDYLIVSHMEPDHAANIEMLARRYPKMQIVANAKTFPIDVYKRQILMGEGRYPVTFGTFHAVFFSVLKNAYHYTAQNIIREAVSYTHLDVYKRQMEYGPEDVRGESKAFYYRKNR